MARFYGFSHAELMQMDMDIFSSYWLMIDRLEAQDMLLSMNAAAYPHMKQEDSKKFHKEFHKKAYPLDKKTNKLLSTEEALKALGKTFNGEHSKRNT